MTIPITHITNAFPTGSSLPVVACGEDKKEYFVKLFGAGNGKMSSVAEYVATSVGVQIGLPMLAPQIVSIDKDVAIEIKNDELYQLVELSYGENVAHRFIAGARVCTGEIDMLSKKIQQCIFLFDTFFLNIDRTVRNMNIITSSEGVFVTDMGASLLPNSLITGIRFDQNAKVIEQLTRHPFYSNDVEVSLLTDRFSMITERDITAIVSAIPSIWLDNQNHRKTLSEGLINSFRDTESFSLLVSSMNAIPRLSEEEVHRRNAINRMLFDERRK
jgi:hypothetical protein